MSENKFYVLEWDKSSSGEFELKITPHDSATEALQQAQNSSSEQHCVSTQNPLDKENKDER